MLKASTRRPGDELSPINWPVEPPPRIDGMTAIEIGDAVAGYVRWRYFRSRIEPAQQGETK